MTSLRARLFTLVAVMTVLVWTAAAGWTYFHTRSEVQRVLDRRLVEAARMVSSLDLASANNAPNFRRLAEYDRQLSCQIWSLEGRLVGRSASAPTTELSDAKSGFSEKVVEGERWRTYSLVNSRKGTRVLVGDNVSVREKLVGDMMAGLLVPSSVALAVLAALLWLAIDRGLAPLQRLSHVLRARGPDDATPLDVDASDTELRPVVDALEGLIGRIASLRETERHFIASAAHELQTPLAGLRTHAQVAARSQDDNVRAASLAHIQRSVDRTARLVRQLIELAREEAMEPDAVGWTSFGAALRDVSEGVLEAQGPRAAGIASSAIDFDVWIDPASLAIALRNLLENALFHAGGEQVIIETEERGTSLQIAICDRGPGIDPADIHRMRKRFVRGKGSNVGSGLGLSIVELVLDRAGVALELVNRKGGGLCARMVVPADQWRRP